jgi:hypothetical protein
MSVGLGNITFTAPSSASSSGGGGIPGVTVPFVAFAVGDGQAGSPVNGQTSLKLATIQGQSLVNVELLVIREGIQLLWDSPVAVNDIRRYNSGGLGGWTFEGGFSFQTGERYQLFWIGINSTIQV